MKKNTKTNVSRSLMETAWFLSCTEENAYLGVMKAWLGTSWRTGRLGRQQKSLFYGMPRENSDSHTSVSGICVVRFMRV